MSNSYTSSVEARWGHAESLLEHFKAKHQRIVEIRDLVRQRIVPNQELRDKRLITAKTARGLAILFQTRAFFDRAASKIEVLPEVNTNAEDKATTKQERWLTGVSDALAGRGGFVYSDAITHGLESGEMILGAQFNPYLAKQGLFPLDVWTPDPLCVAYDRSRYGLTCFVYRETKTLGTVKSELGNEFDRAIRAAYDLPNSFLDDTADPTAQVEVTQYWDDEKVSLWLDRSHVYTRPHGMSRVPFDVGYFYDLPSTRPEERGMGIISPILDMLNNQQLLIDINTTDAETWSRPYGFVFDGTHFRIVQLSPGEKYEGQSLTPIPPSQAPQYIQALSTLLNSEIEDATLPRSVYSGPNFQLSGFALSQYTEGIKARLDDMKKYPELCLQQHYKLLLQAVRKYATPQMAKAIAPTDTDTYLNSFAVNLTLPNGPRNGKQRTWWLLNADDVGERVHVKVSLTPKLPVDEQAKYQQYELAIRNNTPREWAVRNILKVEDVDEFMRQSKREYLMANDQEFAAFMADEFKREMFEEDPKLRKRYLAYLEANGLLPVPEEEEMGMPQEMPAQLPPELQFQAEAMPPNPMMSNPMMQPAIPQQSMPQLDPMLQAMLSQQIPQG